CPRRSHRRARGDRADRRSRPRRPARGDPVRDGARGRTAPDPERDPRRSRPRRQRRGHPHLSELMAVAKTSRAPETGLDADAMRAMYRHMVRARVLDERMWVLNRQGRAPFVISCQGHEAAQVGMAMALRPGHDWIAPYYRDLALTLVLGMTPRDHLLALLARAADPNSGGRQMPAHYGCRRLNIISGGSPVATQVLHAAGAVLASRVRGEDAVAYTSLGEGSTSEGDFHEGLNFAAVHQLPLITVIENNGFAISVPWSKQGHTKDAADRALGYGMPGVIVDGLDPVACYEVMTEAVARGRRGDGPTLIEAK